MEFIEELKHAWGIKRKDTVSIEERIIECKKDNKNEEVIELCSKLNWKKEALNPDVAYALCYALWTLPGNDSESVEIAKKCVEYYNEPRFENICTLNQNYLGDKKIENISNYASLSEENITTIKSALDFFIAAISWDGDKKLIKEIKSKINDITKKLGDYHLSKINNLINGFKDNSSLNDVNVIISVCEKLTLDKYLDSLKEKFKTKIEEIKDLLADYYLNNISTKIDKAIEDNNIEIITHAIETCENAINDSRVSNFKSKFNNAKEKCTKSLGEIYLKKMEFNYEESTINMDFPTIENAIEICNNAIGDHRVNSFDEKFKEEKDKCEKLVSEIYPYQIKKHISNGVEYLDFDDINKAVKYCNDGLDDFRVDHLEKEFNAFLKECNQANGEIYFNKISNLINEPGWSNLEDGKILCNEALENNISDAFNKKFEAQLIDCDIEYAKLYINDANDNSTSWKTRKDALSDVERALQHLENCDNENLLNEAKELKTKITEQISEDDKTFGKSLNEFPEASGFRNKLSRAGYNTLGDFLKASNQEIDNIPKIGQKTMQEIKNFREKF